MAQTAHLARPLLFIGVKEVVFCLRRYQMLWFRKEILHVFMALGIFILSVGCGDFNSGTKSIEELVYIPTSFQTEGDQLHGQNGANGQTIQSPVSFDRVKSFKLAMDDGYGSQVLLASAAPSIESCNISGYQTQCVKLRSPGDTSAMAAIIPQNSNQFTVIVNFYMPNASGQILNAALTLFLIIEHEKED